MSTSASCGRFFAFSLVFLAAASVSLPSAAAETALRRWPAKTAAPQLKLNDLDGREWNAESLRGKVVVLNFWASWCTPCVDEMAYLNDLANRRFGQEKPLILGVNFKESESAVRAFLSQHKVEYPILLDKNGDRFQKWADGVLPTTILIDRRGRPRWRMVGELDRGDAGLQNTLEKMMEQR